MIKKIENDIKNNRLSHAYLIETNNQNFCLEELIISIKKIMCLDTYEEGCNKCNLCRSLDKHEALNLFIIKPEGKNIKKEQVLELQKKCTSVPILARNNVYVIVETEKLNASSANTMLKFIEEPYDNCYGFFITNNKENVINTIKSRCEIIKLNYDVTLAVNEEEKKLILTNLKDYLSKIEEEKQGNILYNKLVLEEKYKEKENLELFFSIMLEIYSSYIIKLINNETANKYEEFKFILNNNLKSLLRKKAIIIDILNKLKYNLNIDLLLDKFVIEMGEQNE